MRTVGEVSQTPTGKITFTAAAIACIALGLWSIRGFIHGSDAIDAANTRIFIDADSLQSFKYTVTPTTSIPVRFAVFGESVRLSRRAVLLDSGWPNQGRPDACVIEFFSASRLA